MNRLDTIKQRLERYTSADTNTDEKLENGAIADWVMQSDDDTVWLLERVSELTEALDGLLLLIQHETNLPESARNGVADSTGTVDEGEVRAAEILENARNAVAKVRKAPQ